MVELELNLPNSVVYIMASFINFKLGLSFYMEYANSRLKLYHSILKTPSYSKIYK